MSSWTHTCLQCAASFRFKYALMAYIPPRASSEFLPQVCSFFHLLSFFLLCPFYTLLVITLFTYLETRHSDVLFFLQGCHCLPDLYLFFLGTQRLLMEYQDCFYSYVSVYSHFRRGDWKKNENRNKGQYSITLPKRALMRQFELKVRTHSLKSALCTCCQTPALWCGVHRIWAETFSHSKLQFLISRKGLVLP